MDRTSPAAITPGLPPAFDVAAPDGRPRASRSQTIGAESACGISRAPRCDIFLPETAITAPTDTDKFDQVRRQFPACWKKP